jgi:phosphoglycerate dehydrogenase-like enzyme
LTCDVILAVDDLSLEQVARIRAAADGWAELTRVPQDSLDDTLASRPPAALVIGWPDPSRLVPQHAPRVILLGSKGYELYEGRGLPAMGVTLCHAGDTYAVAMAELCLAMMFAFVRKLFAHRDDRAQRTFRRHSGYGTVHGSSACILGYGDSGSELATRCRALGMHVTAVRRRPAQVDGIRVLPVTALRDAVAEADHVFNTLPGTAETERLVDAQVFAAMRAGAYFYNVGRGSTVDETALVEALSSGCLAGAGLDVVAVEPLPPTSPLWDLPQVLITGHSAGLSDSSSERFVDNAVRCISSLRAGSPPPDAVTLRD